MDRKYTVACCSADTFAVVVAAREVAAVAAAVASVAVDFVLAASRAAATVATAVPTTRPPAPRHSRYCSTLGSHNNTHACVHCTHR